MKRIKDARLFAAAPEPAHSSPSLSGLQWAVLRSRFGVAVSSERLRPSWLIGTRHHDTPLALRAGDVRQHSQSSIGTASSDE